jgi:hypothetical protein
VNYCLRALGVALGCYSLADGRALVNIILMKVINVHSHFNFQYQMAALSVSSFRRHLSQFDYNADSLQ